MGTIIRMMSRFTCLISVLTSLFALFSGTMAWPQPTPRKQQDFERRHHTIQLANQPKRDYDSTEHLPDHHWQLSKSQADIESFRQKYNLTLVDYRPQDAALMPSWPQAFVQYIFVAPPITCSSTTTHTVNGVVTHQSPGFGTVLSMVTSPFLFVAWTVSFGLTQSSKATGGWVSVLGWSAWFCLIFEGFNILAILPFFFQWAASLTLIVQRWRGIVGEVAYQITDLHGCTPVDGLSYLQQGARAHTYKIFQTVAFVYATVSAALSGGSSSALNPALALIALAELILDCMVATKGTPIVVSGNCLLVELSPRMGFLNEGVSTGWKALTSFMGF